LHPNIPPHVEPHLGEDLGALYRHIRDRYDPNQSPEVYKPEYSSLDSQHQDLVSYLTIRMDRDYTDQSLNVLLSELTTNLASFLKIVRDEERKRLEEEMRAAELAGDHQKILELALKFSSLH
jgi:hypothetical protein